MVKPMRTTSQISVLSIAAVSLIIVIFSIDFATILTGVSGSLVDRLFSLLLVVVLFFGMLHFASYIDNLLRSLYAYSEPVCNRPIGTAGLAAPGVAVFVPVYNEEPEVIESCIRACTAIDYRKVDVYLLDDSTNEQVRAANREISNKYAAHYIHREERHGFKAGAINHAISLLGNGTGYLLVIDADQIVRPEILSDLIPVLETDPTISFIQTPQFFRAKPNDPLSVTYSYQQHIFNKHVCRGLNVHRAVMLTGSNTLFRLSHLRAIDGMDESCITEDIATSFRFHTRGYHGVFLDRVYAEGIAPPDLQAYVTQQLRWAYGTTQLLGSLAKTLLTAPRCMTLSQWVEFGVNETSYLLGGVNMTLFLLPAATLIFGIQILPVRTPLLFIVFLMVALALQLSISIRERHYTVRELIPAQAIINTLSFVYARAIWYIITRRKLPFMVTPKTARQSTKGRSRTLIVPVSLFLAALIAAIAAALLRIASGDVGLSTTIPLFWAVYASFILGSFVPIWWEDGKKQKEKEAH